MNPLHIGLASRIGRTRSARSAVVPLLLASLALAACQTRTNVSATANVPAAYAHVWVTMRQVEFNASAAAGPGDSGWQSFTLSAPQTIDLAAATNGALSQFAGSLSLPSGTYRQMRVVLSDSTESLASSAQSAGALYNDEVDYTDSGGVAHQVPLEIPNAAQGIGFAIDLTVKTSDKAALAALGCAVGGSSTGTSSGTSGVFGASGTFGTSSGTCSSLLSSGTTAASQECASGYVLDSTTGTCVLSTTAIGTTAAATAGASTSTGTQCAAGSTYDATTGSCVATLGSFGCSFGSTLDPTTGDCASTSLNTAATTSTAVAFDASRGLVPYTASGQAGFMLSPRPSGYDLSEAGTIAGQISIAALPSDVSGIEVTAETLSSDGSRHVAVESAPLRSDGSFVLYPLSTASGSPTQYDLVIHGAGIGTVIIKAVPVTAASPASTTAIALTDIALAGSSAFAVNVAPASPVSPRGASIGFYQTLPGSGEAPYLIAVQPVDPFTGTFDSDQPLPTADLSYGTYTSGSTTLAASPPAEGASTYHVAASAPLYGDGPLASTVSPAASGGTATFAVGALPLPSGASADSITGTINVATPGKYDKGELVLTQNGAVVAVAPLDAYLASSQTPATLFGTVPGGGAAASFSDGLYYAEAWVWSAADPAGTLSRQPQSAPIDLRGGSASGVTISIE